MGEALRRGLVHDLRKNVDFEVVPFGKDMIATGTLVETLRHLDREVFATGQRITTTDFTESLFKNRDTEPIALP